jgi:hypothetical protein
LQNENFKLGDARAVQFEIFILQFSIFNISNDNPSTLAKRAIVLSQP